MDFKDFIDNPQELVGKKVLCCSRYGKSISTIERVTKTGFRISGSESLYKISNGYRKGGDVWNVECCQLLTNDKAIELAETWKMKKEEKALRERILEKVKNMDFEQLKKVELI